MRIKLPSLRDENSRQSSNIILQLIREVSEVMRSDVNTQKLLGFIFQQLVIEK